MKIAGIIMIVIGILGIIFPIIALIASGGAPEAAELVGRSLAGGAIWIVIGGLLIHSAKKRQEEKEKKDKWNKQ